LSAPRRSAGRGRPPRGLTILLAAAILLAAVPAVYAQNLGIRDVPLTSWTGPRPWDWTYDALHRLALSGIAGRVVLNTKPMSRREMALIEADVVQRVQENQVAPFDHRSDLQDTLIALMEEFGPELAALGLSGASIRDEPPRQPGGSEIDALQRAEAIDSSRSREDPRGDTPEADRQDGGVPAQRAGAGPIISGRARTRRHRVWARPRRTRAPR
jgi:hypothetical protein